MANEDAVFKFGADTRPVDSALDSLTGKITDFGKTAGLAIASVFAAQKLVGFFNDSTDAALESEKAVRQFNFALKAAGVYSESASKGFQEYAQSLQDLTGVQDEAILAGATNLIQVGELSGETLNRTIVASLDLAAAKGIDAAQSFDMLALAAQGNIRQFSRWGVQVKDGATDAEKLNAVLGFIEGKWSGSAQDAMQGYEGQLKKLSNTWSDLQENIGKSIIMNPSFVQSIGLVTESIKWLVVNGSKAIAMFQNFVIAMTAFGAMMGSALDAIKNNDFSKFIAQQQMIKDDALALIAANNAQIITYDSLAAKINGAVVPAFNAKAKAIQDAKMEMLRMRDAQAEYEKKIANQATFKNFVTGFKDGLKEMSVSVMQLGKMVSGTFVSGFSNAFASVGKAIVKGEDAFSAFGSAILQMLGAVAIQMGQFYIAAGIAAMFVNPGSGIGMIVAGGALSVLGGVLQALGGGSGGAPSAASSGGVGASQPLGETDTSSFMNEMTQDQERVSPNSGVQVVIQGNVLDRRETGLAIAEIINETFNTNGVTITANA